MATVKCKIDGIGLFKLIKYIGIWNMEVNCSPDDEYLNKFYKDKDSPFLWSISSCSGWKRLIIDIEKQELTFYGSRDWNLQRMYVHSENGKHELVIVSDEYKDRIIINIIEIISSLPVELQTEINMKNPFNQTGITGDDIERTRPLLSIEEIQEDRYLEKLELSLSR